MLTDREASDNITSHCSALQLLTATKTCAFWSLKTHWGIVYSHTGCFLKVWSKASGSLLVNCSGRWLQLTMPFMWLLPRASYDVHQASPFEVGLHKETAPSSFVLTLSAFCAESGRNYLQIQVQRDNKKLVKMRFEKLVLLFPSQLNLERSFICQSLAILPASHAGEASIKKKMTKGSRAEMGATTGGRSERQSENGLTPERPQQTIKWVVAWSCGS